MKQRVHIANRILAALVAVVMMAGLLPGLSLPVFAANSTWGGDGTEQSPYLMEDAADLAKLASNVNGGDSCAGKYFRLTNDVDLAGWLTENGGTQGWTPIGTIEHPFSGNFDGAGKSITGLWIERPDVISVGLFGSVKDSVINDVTVKTQGAVNGRFYVGTLVGYAFGGTIRHCSAAGTVTGTSTTGGLTGYQYGGVIDGCSFSGTVTVPDANGGVYAGGLVGYTQIEAVLQNSSADAVVSGYQQVGGLVGFLDGNFQSTVRDCFSEGSVSGYTQIGGLAGGSNAQLIERCYAATAVNGTSQYAGGLIGNNNTLALRDCYATGAVSGSSAAGGLLGRQSSGEKSVSNCYATGRVSANGRVGGLIGEINVNYPSIYTNNFFDSSATAQANGTGSGQVDGIFGKTTVEMQVKATFMGWDFIGDGTAAPTWYIREGETYPLLGIAVDYSLNGIPGDWADLDAQGIIYLRNDGDTLNILATEGPEKPVRIVAWPFSNAAASITGRPGVMYHNLYIQAIGENITLNLKDLQITAPEDQNGILVYSTTPDAIGPDSYVKLNVKGKCAVRGGDAKTTNRSGIQVDSLNVMITGEHLEVYGGNDFNTTGRGGVGLYVTGRAKTTTLDTEYLFLSGGNGYQAGGIGLSANGPSLMKGGTITAVGGNCSIAENIEQYGGVGVNTSGDFTMEGGVLTVTAGQNVNPSNGLTVSGALTMKNDSVIRSAGTNSAVYAQEGLHLSGTASITAEGQNGGKGIWTRGEIHLSDAAQLTAVGGSCETGTGGDGIYMMGKGKVTVDGGSLSVTGGSSDSGGKGINDLAKTGTITIGKGAGEVYIHGGRSKSGEEAAAITSGNAYIATGNIGTVTVAGELKNVLSGDNLYMLTANTSPLKPGAVFEAAVETNAVGLSPSYTYRAASKEDGAATMWLPEGEQTVISAGYGNGVANIPSDVSVTLYNNFNITVQYKAGDTVLGTETPSSNLGGKILLNAPDGYVLANGVTNSLTVDSALLAGGTVGGCTVAANGQNITVDVPVTPREILVAVTYTHGAQTTTEEVNKIYNTELGRNELQRVPFGYEPELDALPLAINTQSDGLDFNFAANPPTAAVTISCIPKRYEITVTYKDGDHTAGTQVFKDAEYDSFIDASEFDLPTGYQMPDGFTGLFVTRENIAFASGALSATADVPVEKTEYQVTVQFMDGQEQVGENFHVEGAWMLGQIISAAELTLPDGYAFNNFNGIPMTVSLIESSAQGTDITMSVAVRKQQISVTLDYQYEGKQIGQPQTLNKSGTDSILDTDVTLPDGYHLVQPWTVLAMTDNASFDEYDVDVQTGMGRASKMIAVEPNEIALTVFYKQGETVRGSMTLSRSYDDGLAAADFTGIDDGFTLPAGFTGLTVSQSAGWSFDGGFTTAEVDVQVVPAEYTVTIQYDDKAATAYSLENKIAYTGSFLPAGVPQGYRLASENAVTLEIGAQKQSFDHTAHTVTVLVPLTPLDYMLTITYLDDGAFVGRQMETVPYDSDFTAFAPPKGYALSGEAQIITVDSAISDHKYRSAAANVPLMKKVYDVTVQYAGYSGENNVQVIPGKRLGDRIIFAELTVPQGHTPVDFTDLTLTASHILDTDTILIDVPVSQTMLAIEIQYAEGETVVGTQVKNMAKNEYLRKRDLNPPFGYCLSDAFGDVRITQAQSMTVPIEAVPAQTVAVSPAAAVLVLNDTPSAYLTAQVSPAVLDMGVTWASEDEAVATVNAYGKVTAVAKGFTTIKAVSRQTDTVIGRCMITVANLGAPYVTTADVSRPYWSNIAYTVTLTGQNIADGNSIEFQLNDSEWMPYSAAAVISQEGETWLSWRVMDGNACLSEGKFGPYLVDLTAPVITQQTAAAASTSQIDLAAAASDENGSGIAGYLWEVQDGEGWVVLSTDESYNHTGLSSNTEYTYRLTVTDLAGNTAAGEITAKTNRASSGGGGGTSYYTIKFDTDGGSAVENQRVRRNDKAAKPADPKKESFAFAGWYTDSELTAEYDFDKAVTGNLILYAKWTEDTEPTTPPVGPDGWKNPFIDVHEGDWFYGNVEYVYMNGIVKGITENTFEPNSPMTRAMLVTMLWRTDDQPEAEHSGFIDVPADAYYAEAAAWAAENGIVKGYDYKTFAPDDPITREQLAAILQRYALYKGYDVSPGADTNILSYVDAEQIGEWAISAVQWAVGAGIITGKTEDTIAPQGSATRAEVAAMLHRFLEKVNTNNK